MKSIKNTLFIFVTGFILIIGLLAFAPTRSIAQVLVDVGGTALLEGQDDHSGIEMYIEPETASAVEDAEIATIYNQEVTWPKDTETEIVDIINPATGMIWMDRNLGASRVALGMADGPAYGDMYQWGRAADGHEKRNSGTTSTKSDGDQPGHGDFIKSSGDWRTTRNNNLWQGADGINNPCPAGYRLPTEAEWAAERASWSSDDKHGAYGTPLKLTLGGSRRNSGGYVDLSGGRGWYWSSTVDGDNAVGLYIYNYVNLGGASRAYGWSVRCIKDGIYVTPETNFSIDLAVADTYINEFTLTLGTHPDATSGFDVDMDQLAPSPPPSGLFDARIKVDGQSYFTFFQPPTVEKTEWTLEFVPETGYAPITLSWDVADLPLEGRMTLTDVIDGSFVNVDMSEQSSLTIEESFITQLILTHQLTIDVTETYREEWNLVSLPVEIEHEGYEELYPSSMPYTLYNFDGTYNEVQTLIPGVGYWLNFSEPTEVMLTGFPLQELDLDLRINWNLISGLSETAQLVDTEDILLPGTMYGFDGTYVSSTTVEPGNAYWIATQQPGSVSMLPVNNIMDGTIGTTMNGIMPINSSFSNPRQDEAMLSQAMMIEFEQEGVSLLPLVSRATIGEQYHPLQLSLPPLPPKGAVDARFENNRWITEDSQVRIQLQQNDEPLHVVVRSSASSVAGGDATQDSQAGDGSRDGNGASSHPSSGVEILFIEKGRELGSITVVYGERIQIPHQADQLMITPSTEIVGQELPTFFALEQNYPNPFNPSTSIEYTLPEGVDVRLEVFNMLGQRVTKLVDAQQQSAGRYTLNFDATDLSSGVYVYRLTAGSFTQTRKMTLLK